MWHRVTGVGEERSGNAGRGLYSLSSSLGCELLVDRDHALIFPWPAKPRLLSASPVLFQLICGEPGR